MGMTQPIILLNETTVLTTAQVEAVVPALQTLFDRDFEPVWRTGLGFQVLAASQVPSGANIDHTAWPIYLRDTTDQPGAGGYHLGGQLGPQSGYVFVKDAMEAGESWTVDLTHEFLEMAGDPTDDVLIALPGMPGYHCLREVCDAVEADTLGYRIHGVQVTDWVTPMYFFGTNHDGSHRYDFQGHIHEPAPALLRGGYLGIQNPRGEWGQVSNFRLDGTPSRRALRTAGRLNRIAGRG